jgi:ribosomal-protein-alanine N-acetyltransferase
VDKYINHHLSHWQARGYGHWAVVTREDDLVVGWTGLEYLPELDQTEVAYLLSKKVHGRGFATEAVRAAVAFGFEVCSLPVIIGLVHPENAASVRVLEKCGLLFTDRQTLWGLEMLRYTATRPE